MARNLATRGVPHGEELGDEGRRARHAAVVAAKLDEDKDEDTEEGTDGGDVDKVLDVAVPGLEGIVAIARGRWRRESIVHEGDWEYG